MLLVRQRRRLPRRPHRHQARRPRPDLKLHLLLEPGVIDLPILERRDNRHGETGEIGTFAGHGSENLGHSGERAIRYHTKGLRELTTGGTSNLNAKTQRRRGAKENAKKREEGVTAAERLACFRASYYSALH